MLSFIQYLVESMNSVVPHQWIRGNRAAMFDVMSLAYMVQFDYLNWTDVNAVEVVFAPTEDTMRRHGIAAKRRYEIIDLKEFGLSPDQARRATSQIFSTVTAILAEYEDRDRPDVIQFTADEPSRRKLYIRLTTGKFQNREYRRYVDPKLTEGVYWLVRRDIPDVLIQAALDAAG